MNNEIKVSLTITLPGRVMFSKEECLETIQKEILKPISKKKKIKIVKDIQVPIKNKFSTNSLVVEDTDGTKERIQFFTRKCIPARQNISINKDAYKDMVSSNCPSWESPYKWNNKNKIARLESHLQRLMENYNGISYSYQIFED